MRPGRMAGAACGAWLVALLVMAAGACAATNPAAGQADGKILVGGATRQGGGYIARLEPNGSLDPGFGIGGVVVDHRLSAVATVVLLPDGKILAGGYGDTLTRYLADGSRDLDFGDGGLARGGGSFAYPEALQALPDGRIVVAGNFVLKMLPTAGIVKTYAADGDSAKVANLGSSTLVRGILAQRDGSVLVNFVREGSFPARTFLARFDSSGSPDPSFAGGAGHLEFPGPGSGSPGFSPSSLASVPGAFLAGGTADRELALARFGLDGAADTTFGSGGLAKLGVAGQISGAVDVEAQADGRIIAVDPGHLFRFGPDGAADSGFGNAGVVEIPGRVKRGLPSWTAQGVVPLPEGYLVTGSSAPQYQSIFLARLGASGAAEGSFGEGGVLKVDPCPGSEAQQRASGCLPSAQGQVRLRRTARGLSLRFTVRPVEGWGEIGWARVNLPGWLRVRTDRASAVKFGFKDFGGNERRLRARVDRRGFTFRYPGVSGVRSVWLHLRPGVLVRRRGPSHAAPFRVRLRFLVVRQEAGEQTIALRPRR